MIYSSFPVYLSLYGIGNTIHGQYTKFAEELEVGDAIVITHPTTLLEETKIISMILSNSSMGVSSSFSSDLISSTSFRYIKAPKETSAETLKMKEDAILGKLDSSTVCTNLLVSTSILQTLWSCTLVVENKKRKADQVEESAFGTYASAGGEKVVYRVKKPGAHGGYTIVTANSNKTLSREDLLNVRSKKKADRHCY